MAKLYNLKILTPERQFFDGEVEALTVSAPDGRFTILANHLPIVMPLMVSTILYKKDDKWFEVFNSEGFMEVRHEGVIVYVQACERPEEIDANRAEEARHRAEERLRQNQSTEEYRESKLALARAIGRLRVSQNRLHDMDS
jgi:F-type H+-transporting ATPase subunit epsilon